MSELTAWMGQAKAAYEADVKRRPNYHDGTPRRRWEELPKEIQESWSRSAKPDQPESAKPDR